MSRRLASVSLLCAWLCASGAMLDVAQGIAWTRMFVGYAGGESIAAAAKDTFDPAKPCSLCLAVRAARDASGPHCPSAAAPEATKVVLATVETGYFLAEAPTRGWPSPPATSAPARSFEVKLQPPRLAT